MRPHRFASDRLFARIDERLVAPVRDQTDALRDEVARMRAEVLELRTEVRAMQRDLADLTTILADASALARARAREASRGPDLAQPGREHGE